jgi:outer membrane lipoprotein carrier protein
MNDSSLLLLSFLLLFTPLVGILPAQAADLPPLEVAKKVQSSYAQTKTLGADFQQTTSSRMSDRERLGAGTMLLAKPGLMRWDYREPDQQVFVCDGEKISMYFAKERQMMVTKAKDYLESDVTYSFFTGKGDIERDFTVAGPEEEDITEPRTTYQLKLTPKKGHPQIDFINIWVDRQSFLLQRLKVTDKFGTITDLVFSKVTTNVAAPAERFRFTPPEGTEIIDK